MDIHTNYLIADKPSDLDNYLLALALGIPILSIEWIRHCCEKGMLLDFNAYRLPNGMNPFTHQMSASTYKQGGVFKGITFKSIIYMFLF